MLKISKANNRRQDIPFLGNMIKRNISKVGIIIQLGSLESCSFFFVLSFLSFWEFHATVNGRFVIRNKLNRFDVVFSNLFHLFSACRPLSTFGLAAKEAKEGRKMDERVQWRVAPIDTIDWMLVSLLSPLSQALNHTLNTTEKITATSVGQTTAFRLDGTIESLPGFVSNSILELPFS